LPYVGLVANEDVRSLLLDGVLVTDEDELYEWSLSLEGGGSFNADGGGSGAGGGRSGSVGGSGSAGGMLKRSFERWVGGLRS